MPQRRSKSSKSVAALPADYAPLLADIKARVQAAQLRAATGVARELNQLYWEIGSAIARAQASQGYGKKVVERLAADLQAEFPGLAGFSPQNVWFMRGFYLAWATSTGDSLTAVRESETAHSLTGVRESRSKKIQRPARVQQAGALSMAPPEPIVSLPWGHNVTLLTKLKDRAARLWYVTKLVASLPKALKGAVPSVGELEREFTQK